MKDLTTDSIAGHILTLATPVALSMLAQIAYQLVDLYFVTKIGVGATAAVNAASNVTLIVIALTQVLGVGTAAVIAHATGRKDRTDANLVFNQSVTLSIAFGIATTILLYAFTRRYMESIAANRDIVDLGFAFVLYVLPGYCLMFPMMTCSSALRGTGVVHAPIAIYIFTVIVNAALAPILIAGWGTGAALGVKGAGLATSLSVLVGIVMLGAYMYRSERYLTVRLELLRPRLDQWRRILRIGLPAGGELVLMFLSTAVVYYAIRDFGPSAQAGYGIGARVVQVLLLPGMAIAFAAGPLAGQNLGANEGRRVRKTFEQAALIGTVVMIALGGLVQWRPDMLVNMFDTDASVVAVATLFLRCMSWTFVAQGLVYTCSNMFQGLGNTLPSLISSGGRFLVFALPAVWLSMQPDFRIEHVWYLSIASIGLQALVSLWLLRAELRRRLVRMQ